MAASTGRRSKVSRNKNPHITCERLEDRTLFSALVISGTSGNDVIAFNVTPAGQIDVAVNGVEKQYDPSSFDYVDVQSGAGTDAISVAATVLPTVIGGEGSAKVSLGDATGLQRIKSTVLVNGYSFGTSIAADDTGDATARAITMQAVPPVPGAVGFGWTSEAQMIVGVAPADIVYTGGPSPLANPLPSSVIPSLFLTTGAGDDTVNLRSTLPGTPFLTPAGSALLLNSFITLDSSGGTDAITLSANGLTQFIHGDVTVHNSAGPSKLAVDDDADTTARSITLSTDSTNAVGTVDGLTAGAVNFVAAQVPFVSLDGGAAGNTFEIQNTPGGVPPAGTVLPSITLNTGSGNNRVTIDATSAGSQLNINCGAGDDIVTVPAFGYNVNGNIQLNGGGNTGDALVVGGPVIPPGSEIPIPLIMLAPGKVSRGTVDITYTSVGTLQVENGAFSATGDLGRIDLIVGAPVVTPLAATAPDPTAVEFNTSQKLAGLEILQGQVSLAPGGDKVLNTSALNILSGTLDLTNNSMLVNYATPIVLIATDPFAMIRKWIFNHQIESSSADARHNLGYADGADRVVLTLAPGSILVKYALNGDADLDGAVNFTDLRLLIRHWGQSDANWDQGDFNYDGRVGFEDLLLLARNFGRSMTATGGTAATTALAPAIRPMRHRKHHRG